MKKKKEKMKKKDKQKGKGGNSQRIKKKKVLKMMKKEWVEDELEEDVAARLNGEKLAFQLR